MLSERTIEILENNDMYAYDRSEQNEDFTREIEFYSPEGEDVIECIWYDGTDEGFVEAFRENAENFDADEHAEMWIESRGERGVPNSIRDLINDAQWIKNKLLSVADELESEEVKENNETESKYLGNAKIINKLSDLPKVGDILNETPIFKSYENAFCISVNAYEYEDIKKDVGLSLPKLSEEDEDRYLFFKVYYHEATEKFMWLDVESFYYLFCILKENI